MQEVELNIEEKELTPIQVLVYKDFKRDLKAKCLKEGVTVSQLTRKLLEEYLKNTKKVQKIKKKIKRA